MKKFKIVTIAEGRYKNYAEMFELALSKAYPEYSTSVFSAYFPEGYPKFSGACVRYLDDFEKVVGYHEYMYITDIDMMITRETPTLFDFHHKEVLESGLCYSNTCRGSETQGPNRLTGLHFVTHDWWEKTKKARKKYSTLLKEGKIGNEAIDDELMLMKIVKESGLGLPLPKPNLIERHHGLHLGTVRAHKTESLQTLRRAVFIRVSPDKARKWQEVVSTSDYSKALNRIQRKDKMAYEEFMIMDKFTKQRAKEVGKNG